MGPNGQVIYKQRNSNWGHGTHRVGLILPQHATNFGEVWIYATADVEGRPESKE
jgi:hypothetical protein